MKKNTKIIRLTENDLERMVRRIIKESDDDYETSTPIKPITIHGKTYKFVEDLPTRELGIGSYVVDNDKGIVLVDGDTPLEDWLDHVMGGVEGEEETEDMDVPGEDYMSSEEDLINAAYELMYDLGDEDVEILDLRDAANILDEELYEGNHGPIMDQRIEDLLSQIEATIELNPSDYDDGEDIEDHL